MAIFGMANTYYVSSSGNDDNSGLSESEAWQTIEKVQYAVLQPGDIVLFEGGQTFTGMVSNESLINGNLDQPLTFGSYGIGKATITGTEIGFWVENTGNVIIKDLIFRGTNYLVTSIWSAGIYFWISPSASATVRTITVENCEVFNYGGWGILFGTESAVYGYDHIRVNDCLVHDNGIGGLHINGLWDSVAKRVKKLNTDVRFTNTKAYHNLGRYDYKDNWSGTGILMTGVNGGVIEHCEAYDNGKDNGSTYAGPVGIFMGESSYVTIQYCKSHNNSGGLGQRDGGGFDIDGGTDNSVIQYCESYENDGAGYGLYQFQTRNPWTNDTIRYNKSTNDGRNTAIYGGITFWGISSGYRVINAQIYGNTINMDKPGTALMFLGSFLTNAQLYDNTFCLASPAVYSSKIPTTATVTNSIFPCGILSIRKNSFSVRRIR